MRWLRSLGWWLVPLLPAVLTTGLVAASETTARICPPYDTPLPPHPEQCLPTLAPGLSGADPQRVALSWLAFGLLAYLVVLAIGLILRARGWRACDIGRMGMALGLAALLFGFALVGGSALVAGDWYLARQPWIGLGLELIVVGLAGTGFFALLLDVVEPVGWWRVLALPPALLVAGLWALYLIIGAPTSGFGGPEHDVATILYSAPLTMAIFTGLTLLVGLPLVAPVALRTGRVPRG
jgi:hypothetical protein